MVTAQFLKTRITPEVKGRVQSLAQDQLVTESVWLKRLVLEALKASPLELIPGPMGRPNAARTGSPAPSHGLKDRRVHLRLRPEDLRLLEERAAARGMASATYVSVLLRAHLRHLAPLPKEELQALKRCVAELGAIGRNLNQMALIAHKEGRVPGQVREEMRAMLRVCGVLRDQTKGLVRANARSWEDGDAASPR